MSDVESVKEGRMLVYLLYEGYTERDYLEGVYVSLASAQGCAPTGTVWTPAEMDSCGTIMTGEHPALLHYRIEQWRVEGS